MRIQLVDTIPDASVGGVVSFEGPGTVTDIFCYFSGTNGAGKTASLLTDLGSPLIVSHHGGNELGDIVSLGRPQSLITMCEATRGRFVQVSTAGAAYEAVLQVPLHLGYDDNGLYIAPNERLQIEVPAHSDADLAAGSAFTCEVTVKLADTLTRYIPRIHDMRVDLGGMRKERLPEGTAVIVLTKGDTTNPDRIAILRGEQRLLYTDWDAYSAIWQSMFMADSAMSMTGDQYIDFTDLGRHMGDALGSGQILEFQGGSDYLQMCTFSLDYHVPSRTGLSVGYASSEIAKVETRMRREGVDHAMLPVVLPERAVIARPITGGGAATPRSALARNSASYRPLGG